MNTYVALLRGINVGGHGKLPMAELRGILDGLGLQGVKTYLQSGNVVFGSPDEDRRVLARRIGAAIDSSRGFAPEVLVLALDDLEAAVAANPFPEGEADPHSLHVSFLAAEPDDPDLAQLDAAKAANERFALLGTVFYLHAPDGIGRSKLAAKVERALGVSATARNWRSVGNVLSLARNLALNDAD